ncbi:MAG: LamG domain-containing protein [Candidatus Thiodiazotropha taylori]|nr:LamG domain-containing protein [Candidatus Thiodiazotropha taylori]
MDYKQNSYTFTFLFSILLLLLTSCGGGGGGGSDESTDQPPSSDSNDNQSIVIDETTSLQNLSNIIVEQRDQTILKSCVLELLDRANLGADTATMDTIADNLVNQELDGIRISVREFYDTYFGIVFSIGSSINSTYSFAEFLDSLNQGINSVSPGSEIEYDWVYLLGMKNGSSYVPGVQFTSTDTLTPTQAYFLLLEYAVAAENGDDNYVTIIQEQGSNSLNAAPRRLLAKGMLGLMITVAAIGIVTTLTAPVSLPVVALLAAGGLTGGLLLGGAIGEGARQATNALEIASNSGNVEMQQIQYEYSQPVYATSTTIDTDRNEATIQEIDTSSIPPLGNSTAIAPPSNIQVSTGNQELTVNWSAVNGTDSYNVYIAQESGIDINNYSSLLGGTLFQNATTPFTISNLINDTTYYIVVTSTNNNNESNPSSEVSATPLSQSTQGNLIAHYSFDNNADDISGNGNHGTVHNNVTFSTGVSGNAAVFDGANGYIQLPNSDTLFNSNSPSEITLSFWLQFNDQGSTVSIINEYDSSGYDGYYPFVISRSQNNTLTAGTRYSSGGHVGSEITLDNGNVFAAGEWHHIGYVFSQSSGSIKGYVDGALVDQATISETADYTDNDPIYIGVTRWQGVLQTFLNGKVDELKIYNYALQDSDILSLANDRQSNSAFAITQNTYSYGTDTNQMCISEFGPNWQIADWNDLVDFHNNGGNLAQLVTELGYSEKDRTWVTRNGDYSASGSRDYFVRYFNHEITSNFAAHDNIDNHFFSLGSWYGTYYVLCKYGASTTTPPSEQPADPPAEPTPATDMVDISGSWNVLGRYSNCTTNANANITFSAQSNILQSMTFSGENWHHDCSITTQTQPITVNLQALNISNPVSSDDFKRIEQHFTDVGSGENGAFITTVTSFSETSISTQWYDTRDSSTEILNYSR